MLLAAGKGEGAVKVEDLNVGSSQKLAALAAAGLVALFLVGGVWRPWLWAVLPAVLLATLLVDAATARGVSWKLLTPFVLLFALAGVAWLAVYAPLVASAAALAVAVIVGINRTFYRLLLARCGLGFAVAGFVPQVVYYLCALTGYALGIVTHLLRPREPLSAVRSAPSR